jgi:hypothetical protein
MLRDFVYKRKKFIALLIGAYFIFFGGLLLYVDKLTNTKTPIEIIIDSI